MRGNTVRKQVLIFAGAGLVLAAAAVAWFVVGLQPDDRPLDGMDRVGVLVVLEDATQTPRVFWVLTFSEHEVAGLCLPSDLRLRAEDGGFHRADQLTSGWGVEGVRAAIEGLVGIDLPFYLAGDLSQLAAWVDAVGGVPITLEDTAVYEDRSSGAPVLMEFRPGTHLVQGREAEAFASAPSIGGSLGRLERQAALLEALTVHSLRSDQLSPSAVELARSAAKQLQTSLTVGGLTQVIERLRGVPETAVQVGALVGSAVEIDGETYTQPQVVETERMIRALLTGEEWIKPEDVFVSVFNGNRVVRVAATTGDYLQARGFRIGEISNADHFGYDKSYIIVLTEEPKAWVLRDALPWEAEVVFPQAMASTMEVLGGLVPPGTDLLLILGGRTEF